MGKEYIKNMMLDALYKESPTTPVPSGSVIEVCRQRSSSSLLKERMSKGNRFQPFIHVNYKYIGYCFFPNSHCDYSRLRTDVLHRLGLDFVCSEDIAVGEQMQCYHKIMNVRTEF